MHLTDEEFWAYRYEMGEEEKRSFDSHLKTCEVCRERLAGFIREENFFKEISFPSVSVDFTYSTIEKVMIRKWVRQERWSRVLKGTMIFSFILAFGLIINSGRLIQKPLPVNLPESDVSFWFLATIPVIALFALVKILDWQKVPTKKM